MSKLIHNAVRFLETDLFVLSDLFNGWRASLARGMREYEAKWLAREAVSILDGRIISGRSEFGHPLGEAAGSWESRRREIARSGIRDPEVDTEFTVVVIPVPGRRELIGKVITERSEWFDAFLARAWVEDFEYWDDTDRPDGLGEEEWANRRDTWDLALSTDPAGRLGQCGFVFQCIERHWSVDPEEVLSFLPDFETRCAGIARTIALKDWARDRSRNLDMCEAIGHVMRFGEWSATEEGRTRLAGIAARVAGKLPAHVTVGMLRGW